MSIKIRIKIKGTEKGLARLQELFDSGELSELEGFEVLEVRELNNTEYTATKISELSLVNKDEVTERLTYLGLNYWDKDVKKVAQIIGLGFHSLRLDNLQCDALKNTWKDSLEFQNKDWGVYYSKRGKCHFLLCINYAKLLYFSYPTLELEHIYTSFKVEPIEANDTTHKIFRELKKVIEERVTS